MSEWGCLGLSMNRGFYTPSFMDTSRIIFTSPIAPKFEKKKLSKKRKKFILEFFAITLSFFPPPPSSTTLSVKTTSSTLSGCLCRKPPPPPYSFFHLHDHPVHHLLAQPSRNLELGLQTKLK